MPRDAARRLLPQVLCLPGAAFRNQSDERMDDVEEQRDTGSERYYGESAEVAKL